LVALPGIFNFEPSLGVFFIVKQVAVVRGTGGCRWLGRKFGG
jgi:hypothetical protein